MKTAQPTNALWRLIAIVAPLVLLLSACSTATDETATAASEETATVDEATAEEDTAATDDHDDDHDDHDDHDHDDHDHDHDHDDHDHDHDHHHDDHGDDGHGHGHEAAPIEPSLSVENVQGDTITVDAIPETIVCLTGACDDMLFSLGIKPAATSTMGLNTLDEYYGEAEGGEIPLVPGSFGSEDVETVIAAEPDLVIGLAGVHEAMRPAIEEHATFWTVQVNSYEDSVHNLRTLAALVNKPDEAIEAEEAFYEALANARHASEENGLKDVTALTMYSSGMGRGVNTDDGLLGGLAAEIYNYPWPNKGGGWETAQVYSIEEILEINPDVIFIQSFVTEDTPPASETLADDPAWQRITAVQNGDVHEVSTRLWTAGRGPNALTVVLNDLANAAPAQ